MNIDKNKIYDALTYPNVYPHDERYDISNSTYVRELFDLDTINTTLLKASISNYNSLYISQLTTFNIQRHHIKLASFKKMIIKSNGFINQKFPKKYICYIDCEFVHMASMKKIKSSKLYDTPISQSDISNNSDIFNMNYMVFINGQLLNNTEVVIDDSKIGIVLNIGSSTSSEFITVDEFATMVDNDVSITLMIVPNYRINSKSIPIKLSSIEDTDNIIHEYMHDNTIVSYHNQTSKFNTILRTSPNSSIVDIFGDIVDTVNDSLFKLSEYITIQFINFIDNPIKLSIDGRYLKLNNFDMRPIPTENMLVFGYSDKYAFIEDDVMSLYYPNIYQISSDSLSKFDIIVFYMDFTKSSSVLSNEHYYNYLWLYSNNIPDIINDYETGNVPDMIKSYQPINFQYSIPNYEKTNPTNNSILHYKIDKLNELINENYKHIVSYMSQIISNNKTYVRLSASSISNIERYDTSKESSSNVIFFDTLNIVITLNPPNPNTITGFRLFIDGYCIPMNRVHVTKNDATYYLYIDRTFVTENSIIEIDRYYGYMERPVVSITKTNKSIDFAKPSVTVYKSDVYAINSETKEIISDNNYDVLLYVDDIDDYVKVMDNFRILSNKFKVVYTSDIEDETITVIVRKKTLRNIEYISGYDTSSYTIGSMMNHDNPSASNYRFFRNNRLVDMSKYVSISQSRTTTNMDKFVLSFRNNVGDSLVLDKTSDYAQLVYQQDIISDNGYVKIPTTLQYPINLRWYDIYLNGLKLNPTNIDVISYNSFYIKNINTKNDLRIYLVNLSNTSSLIPNSGIVKDLNNDIMDIEYIRRIIDSKYSNLPDDVDNVIPDDIIISDDMRNYIDLYKDYLCSHYINANIPQITDDMKEKFPDMIDDDGILYIDTSSHSDSDIIFMLNSNIQLKE